MNQETETDERGGLPSASGLQRIIQCEASLPLTEKLRRNGTLPTDLGSSDSKYGDRVHSLCETILRGEEPDGEGVDKDELNEAHELVGILKNTIVEHFGDITDGERYKVLLEERFWLHDENGKKMFSGRFDCIILDTLQPRAFIGDFKTGWNDLDKGAANAQLAGAAVLLHETVGIEEAVVAIIETGAKIVCETLDLKAIVQWKMKIFKAINNKDADPLKCRFDATEDNCRYCPARLRCPMLRYHLTILQSASIDKDLPDEELEELRDSLELMKPLASGIDREMEARIKLLGAEFNGWGFFSTQGNRKVAKPAAACSKLLSLGVTPTDVFDQVKLSVGGAEKLHKEALGLKGKAAAIAFNDDLGAFISRDETEPKIRKKK